MMNNYQRFDEAIWHNFGKKLLDNKGSDEQIEFLHACRNGKNTFLAYLDSHLLNDKKNRLGKQTVNFEHTFTEAEFRFPPADTQQIIWDAFQKIPRETLGFCGFWGNIIINLIRSDCIRCDYLASNLNGVNETGIYMLDRAIVSEDDKKIDDCVRRILRSMSNPAPRGKRIVFNDFYLGKAYWRWHWANQMSAKIALNSEQILTTLDEKGYGKFSEKMHSGKSYVSQINTLGGLLLFLNANISTTTVVNISKIIDTISYLSAWKAIEMQSPELNQQEIELIANNLKV